MSQTANPVEQLLAIRTKNLAFFERVYPGIYQFFVNYEMKRSKLDVLPETQELDLIENGKHIYQGAKQYAPREVDHFLNVYDYGKKLKSIRPLFQGEYKNPRFFARSLDEIYQKSPLSRDGFDGYTIPSFFPMMVFMGAGLGLHIEHFCAKRQVQNLVIVETDMDRFMASLYVTDWEALATPYLLSEEQSIHFILIPDDRTEQQVRDVVWNQLIEHCPIFPVMTLFYNHLGEAKNDRVIDAINADLYVHLLSFGNYDDELNQLNNVIHNIGNHIPKLPPKTGVKIEFPVCVVGSGPSLDQRLPMLKQFKDSVIIISCGTALRALYEQGIVPDMHVELESDYNTYAVQSLMEDKNYLKSVKIVGAAQLNPLLFDLFGEKRMFFKKDSGVAEVFASDVDMIENAAPSCTNAALALALHFQFDEIYLFGLDYGFADKEQHHAGGTLYYKDYAPQGLKNSVDYKDNELFEVESSSGGKVFTTPFLYASKRRVDNMLATFSGESLFNCSDGVKLDHASWADKQALEKHLSASDVTKKEAALDVFFKDSNGSYSTESVKGSIDSFTNWLTATIDSIKFMVEKDAMDLLHLNLLGTEINRLLCQSRPEDKNYYYFIRGSIWHFLLLAYSHGHAINDEKERQLFLNDWQVGFLGFLNKLPAHLHTILDKDYRQGTDPWLRKSITQLDVASLDWQYKHYSISNEQVAFDQVKWTFVGYNLIDGKYSHYE
jgi:hypothetical protein